MIYSVIEDEPFDGLAADPSGSRDRPQRMGPVPNRRASTKPRAIHIAAAADRKELVDDACAKRAVAELTAHEPNMPVRSGAVGA